MKCPSKQTGDRVRSAVARAREEGGVESNRLVGAGFPFGVMVMLWN